MKSAENRPLAVPYAHGLLKFWPQKVREYVYRFWPPKSPRNMYGLKSKSSGSLLLAREPSREHQKARPLLGAGLMVGA